MDSVHPFAQESNPLFVSIPLSGKRGEGKFAIVDPEDADLAQFKWCVTGTDRHYAIRRVSTHKTVLMHRIILERKLGRDVQEGAVTDHRNHHTLDNRRHNLREATEHQNSVNRSMYERNKCRYIGVTRKRWYYAAHIVHHGEQRFLGGFKTAIDASFAYDKAALELRGEFASLNHDIQEVLAWVSPPLLHKRQPRTARSKLSGYYGVTLHRKSGLWKVQIGCDGKKFSSYHKTAEEAAIARDRVAIEWYGDEAILNFPKENYQ